MKTNDGEEGGHVESSRDESSDDEVGGCDTGPSITKYFDRSVPWHVVEYLGMYHGIPSTWTTPDNIDTIHDVKIKQFCQFLSVLIPYSLACALRLPTLRTTQHLD